MVRFISLAALALGACASTCPPALPKIETVEVSVPIRKPCEVPPVPAPAYIFDSMDPAQPIDAKVAALLEDRLKQAQTERLLRAALDGCTQ